MFLSIASYATADAEVIYLSGRGEKRDSASANWVAAAVKDHVKPGGFVQTLTNSQLGLLLPNRTQMRLNQNSQMQIKSVTESAEWTQVNVRLNAGRAWSQARPQTTVGSTPKNDPRISMETPSAALAIRGTDWEVEVLPDGSTQLVVLSGTVEMANDFGALKVGKGEAAIAEPGKAPVKLTLVNPKLRVQWVSSWKPQPRRWTMGLDVSSYENTIIKIEAGEWDAGITLLTEKIVTDPAAAVLIADIRLSQGDIDGAIELLKPHVDTERGAPIVLSLFVRALARADRLDEARRFLDNAKLQHSELLLAMGELAILDGDVPAARLAFRKVLETQPDNAEAWYGLGLIESERENVKLAREALVNSLAANPKFSVAQSEEATVETFAGNLGYARGLLDDLLAREPGNYVALTALGINLLKSGRANEALEAFLKAGTIEPRYARAWLYSGVAFYQLGERYRAVEAFHKAAELDTKDPLPHLLASLAIGDTLDYGAAISAAQQAQKRMPYLKSLNQVANDQKGSANLGYSLSNFGMEEWAIWYAHEAYSPFWAGSHLFLADRYTGKFNKNSELFKGFLTAPTSFGASNRNSSLTTTPGHYGKIDVFLERANWSQTALIGTANGMVVEPMPVAYFVSGDLSTAQSRDDPTSSSGNNITVGIGIKPRHDIGIFGFATTTDIKADLRTASLVASRLGLKDDRVDFGANIKISADNQLWLKSGSGKQVTDVSGRLFSADIANHFNNIFGTNIFVADGQLDRFHTFSEQNDAQFRQTFGNNGRMITWGVEHANLRRPGEFIATFSPVQLLFSQDQKMRSTDVYLSGEWKQPNHFTAQADLWVQTANISRSDASSLNILLPPITNIPLSNVPRQQQYSELNPRLGLIWYPGPLQSLRLAAQRWRSPASINTLGPVDTVGIPINDRLLMAGGIYKLARLQFDQEGQKQWYFQIFIDLERIDNGLSGITSVVPNIDLNQLESLRNRREVFTAQTDVEKIPVFKEGKVNTFGISGNILVSNRQSISMRYLRRHNWQTGANSGLSIPYLSDHMLYAASRWRLPERWLLATTATYRSTRFMDDLNLQRMAAGWNFGVTIYWESADKKSSIQGILDNLLSNGKAATDNKAHLIMRYTYKF